jgi:hypothetical protein
MSRAARFACSTFLALATVSFAHAQNASAPKPAASPAATAAAAPADAAPADVAPVKTSPVSPGLSDYLGTLDGTRRVHFTLIAHADGSITGSYFLLSSLSSMNFSGKAIDPNSFSARVANAKGPDSSPYLYLKVDKSHTSGDWLSGALYGEGGANQHHVSIALQSSNPAVTAESDRYAAAGAKDEALVEKNALAFWQAVTGNQPQQAAALVSYPLAYTESGRRTLVHTPADFEKKFPLIFTAPYVAQLKNITPKAMSANDRGIMMGNGQVWFNDQGMAFALNNEPVKMYAGKHFLSNAGWVRGASHSTATKSSTTSGSAH